MGGSRSAFKVIIKLKEKGVIFIFLLYFLCNDFFFCFDSCSTNTSAGFSMVVLYLY